MTPNTEDVNIHSDESKIKRQIKLDVIYFVDNVSKDRLGVFIFFFIIFNDFSWNGFQKKILQVL